MTRRCIRGRNFRHCRWTGRRKTEVLLLNTGDPLFDGMDEEKADYTSKEAEARLIAGRSKNSRIRNKG